MEFSHWYNRNHKKILVLPATILLLSVLYLGFFYIQTGDIIRKDVSLTGGSTITIFTQITPEEIESTISQEFKDYSTTAVSDNSGRQTQLIITVTEEREEDLENLLEDYLGYSLTPENSSKETTSASLSSDFYKQLIIAVILAFFWMSAVVFLIFAKGKKIKFLVVIINILFGFFLGFFFLSLPNFLSAVLFISFISYMIYTYIKHSVPSFAVMLCAFSDIVITLAIVNLVGMKISTAGIVAFLMLIGYSVDTDILLTTRLLNRREGVNKTLFEALKTGVTMTLTSIIAISAALIVVYPFASVLNQIFTILLIGLGIDLLSTWVANAGIIKWFVEKKR